MGTNHVTMAQEVNLPDGMRRSPLADPLTPNTKGIGLRSGVNRRSAISRGVSPPRSGGRYRGPRSDYHHGLSVAHTAVRMRRMWSGRRARRSADLTIPQ